MRVLAAPNSFKGSLSALEVAAAIEAGLKKSIEGLEVIKLPVADGGDGTVEALVAATSGRIVRVRVAGPLGTPVDSYYGILGDGETAVVEMAAASGLAFLAPHERNPLKTTTYGTGELIRLAREAGCKKIIVGIGGSATNDGGAGMAQALGAHLLDSGGREIGFGGAELLKLERIDMSDFSLKSGELEVVVACDVDNPLCGERGASRIYGPQKGATPEMVELLDKALARYADVIRRDLGVDVKDTPGAGAAGGLGAGLLAFVGARLAPGVELVMEAAGFEQKVELADLVVTGEGRVDSQTLYGKAPVGVARAAKKHGKPVVAIAGSLGDGLDQLYAAGIDVILPIVPGPCSLEESMARASEFIEACCERLGRTLRLGGALRPA